MSHSPYLGEKAKEKEGTWVRLGLSYIPSQYNRRPYPEVLRPSICEFQIGNHVIDEQFDANEDFRMLTKAFEMKVANRLEGVSFDLFGGYIINPTVESYIYVRGYMAYDSKEMQLYTTPNQVTEMYQKSGCV